MLDAGSKMQDARWAISIFDLLERKNFHRKDARTLKKYIFLNKEGILRYVNKY